MPACATRAWADADLTNVDLSGADLTDASLRDVTLTGADLAGATLTGLASSGITGTPASLPANWSVAGATWSGRRIWTRRS